MNKQRDQIAKEAMQYRVELIAYARAFVGDYLTAEDIVQQAFLVCLLYTSPSPRDS